MTSDTVCIKSPGIVRPNNVQDVGPYSKSVFILRDLLLLLSDNRVLHSLRFCGMHFKQVLAFLAMTFRRFKRTADTLGETTGQQR